METTEYRSALVDPSRKSARGPFRYAYTEEDFERKLRDEKTLPLTDEALPSVASLKNRLLEEQARELLHSFGLTGKRETVCFLMFDGWTATEIAVELGISERQVWNLIRDVRAVIRARLAADDPPSPSYGWQEVFLHSQRRRGL
jgi:DNA-directed RNA polymerase specialized sigma24 family protein